ncbi:cytochrome P450 [Suillus hirtellus]|nr:cytochrome P450 [Suillus hirtellus]
MGGKTISIAIIIAACTLIIILASAARQLPLPPGPPGCWLVGNMPKSYVPFQFVRWTEQYGPVFSLKQGPRIFVIIGCHQAAVDIMEKEGVNVANHPCSVAVHKTLSEGYRVILEGNTERWHWIHRVLHANLRPKAAETYEPMQTRYVKNVVPDILNDPKNHQGHNMRPGEYLVDVYPILQFILGYLSQLKAWNREEMVFYQEHLDEVQRQMHEGTARPSCARFMLENQKQYQIEDRELAFLAGVIFGAGTDATTSAMSIMMMAAATYPDAQAHVQKELDDVVEHMWHRLSLFFILPTFANHLRWRPVSFGGFLYHTSKDIIWKNYLIPAGATVIGNHCSIDDTGHVCNDLQFFTFGFGCW